MQLGDIEYPFTLKEEHVWPFIKDNIGLYIKVHNQFWKYREPKDVDFEKPEWQASLAIAMFDLRVGETYNDFKEAYNGMVTRPVGAACSRAIQDAKDRDTHDKFSDIDVPVTGRDGEDFITDDEALIFNKSMTPLYDQIPKIHNNRGVSKISAIPFLEDEWADALAKTLYKPLSLVDKNYGFMSIDEFKYVATQFFVRDAWSVYDLADTKRDDHQRLMRQFTNRSLRLGRKNFAELVRQAQESLVLAPNMGYNSSGI